MQLLFRWPAFGAEGPLKTDFACPRWQRTYGARGAEPMMRLKPTNGATGLSQRSNANQNERHSKYRVARKSVVPWPVYGKSRCRRGIESQRRWHTMCFSPQQSLIFPQDASCQRSDPCEQFLFQTINEVKSMSISPPESAILQTPTPSSALASTPPAPAAPGTPASATAPAAAARRPSRTRWIVVGVVVVSVLVIASSQG